MRLVTHNMLVCNVKACVETASRTSGPPLNFPFRVDLAPTEAALKQEESDFNPVFVARLLPKLDWAALRQVASELGIAELPEAKPAAPEEDEEFLRSVHDLIMDVSARDGAGSEARAVCAGARARARVCVCGVCARQPDHV